MEPFATTSYPAGVKDVQASVSNHPRGQTLPFLKFITVISRSMIMYVSDYMCAPTYLGTGVAKEWKAQRRVYCTLFLPGMMVHNAHTEGITPPLAEAQTTARALVTRACYAHPQPTATNPHHPTNIPHAPPRYLQYPPSQKAGPPLTIINWPRCKIQV